MKDPAFIRQDSAGPDRDPPRDLGDWLVRCSVCDERILERGRAVAAESGQGLSAVMLQLGLVTEADLATTYAAMLGRAVIGGDVLEKLEEPPFAERISARFIRQARVVPLHDDGVTLRLLMADPLDDYAAESVAMAVNRVICREVGRPSEVDATLNRLYPEDDTTTESDETTAREDLAEDDTDRLKDLASEAPIIRLVNQIIFRAVENRASDIHIEPDENRLLVRYRYDGVLHEADSLSARMTDRKSVV